MKKNIIANFFGRIWGILSGFLFIPLYIRYLGFESYSVISFTLVLAGIMAIMDGGLTATLSREFARKDNEDSEKVKVYQTLETCYLFVTLSALSLIIIFSGIISEGLTVQSYSKEQISFFLKIVSIDIAFQLILRFYMGGLLGLNKQIVANFCQIGWGILRNGGVVLLIFYMPSLKLFFIWQSIATILFALIIKYILDKEVYKNNFFRFSLSFDSKTFSKVRKFTGGMLLISLISAFSSQMDKIFISKMLSLDTLGHYTLAVSLSSALIVLVSPIATAILPQFTSLYSLNLLDEARNLFNRYSIIVSIIVFGFLSNMVFFDEYLVWIWTGDHQIARLTYRFVPFVASAYAFIALQSIPYHVAIANGYTKLNNIIGIVSIFIIFPGYILSINTFGGIGAAYVFMVVQMISLFIYVYFINKRFIKEKILYQIYFKQIILPMFISFVVAFGFSRISIFNSESRILSLVWIGVSTLTTLIITSCIMVGKKERETIYNFMRINKS